MVALVPVISAHARDLLDAVDERVVHAAHKVGLDLLVQPVDDFVDEIFDHPAVDLGDPAVGGGELAVLPLVHAPHLSLHPLVAGPLEQGLELVATLGALLLIIPIVPVSVVALLWFVAIVGIKLSRPPNCVGGGIAEGESGAGALVRNRLYDASQLAPFDFIPAASVRVAAEPILIVAG